MKTLTSNFIVLKKTPYQESSLIISAISSEYGKLSFVVKGARRITKTKQPIVDIFRELNIEFKESKNELYTPINIELISNFDKIALKPKIFLDILKTSNFLLKNTYSHIQCPKTYSAFKTLLIKASNTNFNSFEISLLKLVFLYENGLLPDFFEKDTENRQQIFLKKIIAYAEGKIQSIPHLSKEYQDKFSNWILSLCKHNQLE